MATESFVNVTEGSGKKLHTNQRTIGANAVEDEYVLPGEFPLPGYFAVANAVAATTANDHLLQVMAGASLKVRIRRISVSQNQLATARGILQCGVSELLRQNGPELPVYPSEDVSQWPPHLQRRIARGNENPRSHHSTGEPT